jgi:hypothetical protein
MRSIGLPELLVVLAAVVLLVGFLNSRRRSKAHKMPVATSTSSISGSSGYYRHRGNCPKCGTDLDTNDPHAPGCPRGGG